MREMKAKAWDKTLKKWLNPDEVWMAISGKLVVRPTNTLTDFGHPLVNIELVWYTGLKDKNGKEIYEGDIVKTKYGAKGAQDLVVKELGVCGVFFTRVYGGGGYFYWRLPQRDTMEVIGNIYENPLEA